MNTMGKILTKIVEENTADLDGLSRELGLRGPRVRSIIELMAHEGYLEEIRCGSGCGMCSRNCDCVLSSKIKMYRLTGKGAEYIKRIKRTRFTV